MPFYSSSFRYRLTYIDRYVINSGCVMRTGYFYPNQSRRLKCKLYFFSSTRFEEALDNFANKLSDSGLFISGQCSVHVNAEYAHEMRARERLPSILVTVQVLFPDYY